MNKNCGIYKITSPTGRVYIGQSNNLKRRFKDYEILSRVIGQPILYNSLFKYGYKLHQFDIIEYCSEEDLNCSERFWQDQFDAIGENGLNCNLTECGEKRRVFSERTIKLLSDSKKGELNPNFGAYGDKNSMWGKRGLSPKSIPVVDISTGITYKSIGEAADKLNICKSKLKGYLKGTYKNITTLRYKEDFDKGIERPLKISKTKKKVIDIKTQKVFESIEEAAKENGINRNTLLGWLNGRYKNKSDLRLQNNTLKTKSYNGTNRNKTL